MTFKHKLSVRLALMRDALLLVPVTALLACEKPVPAGPDSILTQVAVFPAHITLHTRQKSQFMAVGLTATGDTANIAVTWTATGGSIADTFSNGRQHFAEYQPSALPGTYLVVAADGPAGTADTGMVTVIPTPVASVALSPAVAGILLGATLQLIATPQDSGGNPLGERVVNWSSSAPSIASVSTTGLVSGLTAGSATITATSEGKSGTSAVTVTIVPVASVTVSPISANVLVGATQQLSAVTKDAAGNTLTGRVVAWSSSNTSVATVNGAGLITGQAAGLATITATSEGKSGTSAITVSIVPVASVTVSPVSASVLVGATQQLSALTTDVAGNTLTGRVVTWSSSNTSVATVSGSGLVSGLTAGSATITATSEGKSGTSVITVTSVPVASVTLSPATASVLVGATQQLSVVTKDAAGNTLSGRVVTWSTSNTSVATVSGSGLVTAQAPGSATITATSEGRSGTSTITVSAPVPSRPGFYVTPTGSAGGDGSATRPWDLATALSGGGGRVQPGDTIWLRGGIYTGVFTGNLNGTATRPIVVHQYPGERATLVGTGAANTLNIFGSYTWYQGFEVIGPPAGAAGVVDLIANGGGKIINLVIHEGKASAVGMFVMSQGQRPIGGEMYGCIVYNNLNPTRGTGSALYINNSATNGTKTVRDNIMFNSAGYGLHAYSGTAGEMVNINFSGNVIFNSGLDARSFPAADLLLLAPGVNGVTYTNNYTYATRSNAWAAEFNRPGLSGTEPNVVVTGNFLHGTTRFGPFTAATVTNNTFYSVGQTSVGDLLTTEGSLSNWIWGTNTHYRDGTAPWAWRHPSGTGHTLAGWKTATGKGATDTNPAAAPTGTQVIVRPNAYEAGRANIIIYNWAQAATVDVAPYLAGVLSIGQSYNIVNAQDFYGTPVASGVYSGAPINVPMAGIQSPAPLYASYNRPVTGPTFQVFVVRLQGS